MKRHLPLLFLLGILLPGIVLLAGCGGVQVPPPPVVEHTVIAETPAASPVPPTATVASAPDLPAPSLFDTPWDDRTLFAPGLIPAEQDALSQRPNASIYHIDFKVSDDLAHVSGKLEVRYANDESVVLNEVIFRLFPNILGGEMTVSDVTVNGRESKTLLEEQNSVLRVGMPAPLHPGDQVVIAMTFEEDVPTTPGSNYAVLAYMDDVLALAAEALMDGGVKQGLKREDSSALVKALFEGFVPLLQETDELAAILFTSIETAKKNRDK